MRRVLHSTLLTIAAVPALLAVPVVALPSTVPAPHAVAPAVRSLPLAGVDAAALGELRAEAVRVAPRGTAPAVVAPAVLTGPLTTKAFDLVAVGWRQGAAVTSASVRVREHGTWSAWTALETGGDDGPDAGSPDAVHAAAVGAPTTTSPLLTARADGVQVRVDTATGAAPAGLTLDLVDGGRSGADAASGGVPGAAQAATPEPRIVSRAEWGADERLVKAAPVLNGSVKALIVHHTDTVNTYSPDQAFAQVRSLYAFHTKVRGWNDVGYNFIVDRYGRVYEGRRGSVTAAVMGAHAGGFNAQTMGVAVLGTFSKTAVPAAVENALVPLLAWKAATYGINPVGRASLVSAGGSYTKYKAGTAVGVYGIAGHRDVDSTECPGDAAYPRLPSLRSRAAALMVPALIAPSLTDAPTTVAGRAVSFSATIPTRQKWWMTVGRSCGGPAVRVVSGTSTGRIVGSWDLRDTAGRLIPPGAYRVTVTSSSPVGVVTPFARDVEVLATPESLASAAAAPSTAPSAPSVASVRGASRIPLQVVSPSPSVTAAPTVAPSPSPSASPSAPPSPSTSPSASPGPSTGTADPIAPSNGCPVQRVAGTDPALTSVVAGRLAHPDARTVVLVNGAAGEPLGQALAAAPLAARQGAPLLLTDAADLPAVVAEDITARKVTTAWIVGSSAVVSPAVESRLRALGVTTITRVAGADRWATAAAVAAVVGAPAHQAVLAPGDPGEMLDTLVAASSAAAAGRPVLLTSRTGVPAATLTALRALHVTDVTVIGSTVAIPESTLGALARAGVVHRVRVVGRDRWATAVAVGNQFAATTPTDRVVLTSGLEVGADLLVASGQARRLLLTTNRDLPAATSTWLAAHTRPGLAVSLIARPAAAATTVLRAVQDLRTS